MSSEQKDIRLEYTVTEDDFVGFATYYYRHSPEGKRGRLRALLLGAAVFTFFAATEWNNPEHGAAAPLRFALYLTTAAAMVGAAMALYHLVLRPWIMRRMARGETFSKMLGKTALTITDGGIRLRREDGSVKMSWREVHRIGETSGHVFLLIGPLRAIIIPHQAFPQDKRSAILETMRAWRNAAQGD